MLSSLAATVFGTRIRWEANLSPTGSVAGLSPFGGYGADTNTVFQVLTLLMGDQGNQTSTDGEWNQFLSGMNDQLAAAMEANVEAQEEFFESWNDFFNSMSDSDRLSNGMEGHSGAFDVWMDAAEEAMERMQAAAEGEDVSPKEFRDLWLDSANEAFKEVMSTDAFAAFTSQRVEDAAELRQARDEVAQATLHELGFATEGDMREIGDRLVELERRQHEVERKLDRLIEHVEEDG